MTDKYDGCYNCSKRTCTTCPKYPKGIRGCGPCEMHELMSSFQYGREAKNAYQEFQGEKHGATT